MRPHERTLAGPKADRLKLLRAARANLSIVFLLYEDREHELRAALAPGARGASRSATARDEAGASTGSRASTMPAAVESRSRASSPIAPW